MKTGKNVLVTGISGFLGSHTALKLLQQGYHVTGTLRDLKRADDIRRILANNTTATDNLELVQADLQDPEANTELAPRLQALQTELIDSGTAIDDYGKANC